MTRVVFRVNVNKLSDWIAKNEPMGMEKLAVAARVSKKTIERMLNGQSIGNSGTRCLVATATGIPEEVLFPMVRKRIAKTA